MADIDSDVCSVSTGRESNLEGMGTDVDEDSMYGGRTKRRRSHTSRSLEDTLTNQAQLLALSNSNFVLYVNSPQFFRMVFVHRTSQNEASIRVYEEVIVKGVIRRADDLKDIVNSLYGRKAYSKSKHAWYVSKNALKKMFRVASLKALTGGLPCFYIMASKSVKQPNGLREKVSEVYRADSVSGNFLFPWAGIENRHPNPELFFKLNRDPAAFAKYEPKFLNTTERQTYLPYSCTSFKFEEKARKVAGRVEEFEVGSDLVQDAFEALRKKPRQVARPPKQTGLSYAVDDALADQFYKDVNRKFLPGFDAIPKARSAPRGNLFAAPY